MWSSIILFLIILFLYVHIQHQYKYGDDLEIYEYEYTTPKELQTIVHYKQPVLFSFVLPDVTANNTIANIQVKDRRDYHNADISIKTYIDPIELNYSSANGLFSTDTKSIFYSDQNYQHVQECSSWKSWFKDTETHFKPSFSLYSQYDLMYGSAKTQTVAKYYRESHTYLYLPPEKNTTFIRIRMIPLKKAVDHLTIVEDYVNYEFWCKENLFNYHSEKLPTVEFFLNPGSVLYIPAYWIYSIEYQTNENEVCFYSFTTGANALANLKPLSTYFLQQQNIHETWLKPFRNTLNLDDPSTDIVHEEHEKETPKENTIVMENDQSVEKLDNNPNGEKTVKNAEEVMKTMTNDLVQELQAS